MQYHSDRFDDYSLLIFEEGSIIGLLPANIDNSGNLISHRIKLWWLYF